MQVNTMKKALILLGGAALLLTSTTLAAGQSNPLEAFEFRDVTAQVAPSVDATPHDAILVGTRSWRFALGNHSQTAASQPAITVGSDLDPELFPEVGAFPVTVAAESLGPEQSLQMSQLEASDVEVSFSPGFDSSRSMSPLEIPANGGVQTVTIRVRPR